MCGTCGCTQVHDHSNHAHLVSIEQDIFAKNNEFAFANKNYFLTKKILALNVMSSPGSGKTTLLVKTITDMKNHFRIAAVQGDQQTDLDAKRIAAAGAEVLQINTGRNCHLDAHMVGHAGEKISLESGILFIENVGNLVCPALFHLGEAFKIVILSVTEGDDKPLKYPDMFRSADLMIFNKIDLLPYVDFDLEKSEEFAHRINPKIQSLKLSAKTGEGLQNWYQWLEEKYQYIFKKSASDSTIEL